MTTINYIARAWLPPAAIRMARRLLRRGARYEGRFRSWSEAEARSTGYASGSILKRTEIATRRVLDGEAAWCRDGVCFDRIEYSWPLLGMLLRSAALNRGELRVLDFGGALGCSYLQCREFLAGLARVQWSVVEQSHVVECGRRLFDGHGPDFFCSIEESLVRGTPDVILVSSVLQYLKDPYALLRELGGLGARSLIIDRTPFSGADEDVILVQHVPASIYRASYPTWVFSDARMRRSLDRDWKFIDSIPSRGAEFHSACGVDFEYRGLLLERREC